MEIENLNRIEISVLNINIPLYSKFR